MFDNKGNKNNLFQAELIHLVLGQFAHFISKLVLAGMEINVRDNTFDQVRVRLFLLSYMHLLQVLTS